MSDNEHPEGKSQKESIKGNYEAGLIVDCWVRAKEPGGYAVSVGLHQDTGFLPTQRELQLDSWVSAQYVCVSNWLILLSDSINS
ncbi:MAG TPA: hypothetical protein V6C89_18300 [Drouetiella sp.]